MALGGMAMANRMDKIYRSYSGHIVLRVAPGGSTYEVFIERRGRGTEVAKHFGPYKAG